MISPVLTLDRGNSTLDLKLWGAGTLRERLAPGDLSAVRAFLGEARPALAIGITVVRDGLAEVAVELAARGVDFHVVDSYREVPLEICYQDPASLGLDRLVGALAASLEHDQAVIVDCGTAVTINLLRDGRFLGGAIAPGPAAMARGLRAVAPALPQADLDAEICIPADSTTDAVNAGARLGFVALVDGLVERVAEAAGMSGAPVLLTGGEAGRYRQHGRLEARHVPDLIHQGLRWLAQRIAGS